MHIDKILQKATKSKKQPHWCIDHQKWETEKHDTVEPWNNQVQKADADDEIPWGGEEHKPKGMYTDRNIPDIPIPPTKLVKPGDKFNLQDEAKTAHQNANLARLAASVKERFGQEAADKILPPDKGQQMGADAQARTRFVDYVKVGESGLENPRPGARGVRNSIENSLLKLMKAEPGWLGAHPADEEYEEEALREAGIRGLPSARHPSRGQDARADQAERNIYRSPKSPSMTAGLIRGEGDKPEFVRDEFGNIRPSRAERNRALLTSHTDISTDVEAPYSAGRTYDPAEQPAEGRKGRILSQHVRREDRPVTAGERAEGAGVDTSVPFPRAMTQINPVAAEAMYAQERKQDLGGGENKGMKQPRGRPKKVQIEESLLKLIKEGAPEEEETLTDWMPPGTPRDPRERPMNELQLSNRQLANLERTEGVKFPRHPKGHPKAGQWTGANPIPNHPPEEQDIHPGSIAPPNMEEAFQKFRKMWVRKSTPRPFSVEDNLRFLMKGEGKQLPLPGMESPEPKNPAGEPGHLEPSKRTNKEQVSDIWAKIRDEVKRRRGLEKDTESEDASNKAENDKWEERESPEIDVPGRLGAHYKEMYGTSKLRAGQSIPGDDWDCPWCDKQLNTRAHNLFTHGGRKPIGGWMGDEEITPEQFHALSQPSPAARERAEMVLNNQRLDAKGLGHMKTPLQPEKTIMNSLLKLMKASKVANMPAGPTASTMQSGIGGKPAKTSGEWKAVRGHGLGGAGFATPPQDGDNIHADLVPIMLDEDKKNVEKSLLSLMKYGSMNLDKQGPAPAAPRRTAEEEEMMGGSGPGGDPTGMGAEVAGMIGSIAGMAAGGKKARWAYEEDDKAPPGTGQGAEGAEGATAAATTGTEAAGTAQTNPQQGQGFPPPGNEAAEIKSPTGVGSPDMGQRMKFDQPNQTASGPLPIDPKTGMPEGAKGRTAGPVETSAYWMGNTKAPDAQAEASKPGSFRRFTKPGDTGTQKKPPSPFGD